MVKIEFLKAIHNETEIVVLFANPANHPKNRISESNSQPCIDCLYFVYPANLHHPLAPSVARR